MSINDYSEDWGLSDRGKKDAERHQKKIDDAIRKNVKDVISEESIISKKRGRKIRIPVRGLRDYRFIYGGKSDGGVGQGDGEDGDVIARKEKKGGSNKPGDSPGDDVMETEIDIDYLINIMFQDLGLPWIDEKTKIQKLVPSGWKFESIVKKGIIPRIHKKRTYIETLKRTAAFIGEISNETGCSEDDAEIALSMAKGDINEAINIIRENRVDRTHEPIAIIDDEDLRYKQIENATVPHSNAAVIAMMDTSGSMTLDKKYLARSMLFWLVEFLKKTYDNVDIKFIQHTTEAHIVDEDTFFHKMECHTKGHLVELYDGALKDISDIKIGDIVNSISPDTLEKEPKEVIKVFSKKSSKLKKVEIKGGPYLLCTDKHKYFCFNKIDGKIYEKESKEIDIKRDMMIIKTENLKPLFTDDYYYLLGFLAGDGYIKERTFNITDKDINNLEELKRIFDYKNIKNKITTNDRNRITVNNKRMCDDFRNNYPGICKRSPYRYIDDIITKESPEKISSYLSGIFDAEGNVSGNGISIEMSSMLIIKQIMMLLQRFGIFSTYRPHKTKNHSGDDVIYYRLRITQDNVIMFNRYIGFRSIDKKKLLNKIVKHKLEKSTNTRSPYLILDDKISNIITCKNSNLTGYNYFKYIPYRFKNSYIIPRKYVTKLIEDGIIEESHYLCTLLNRGLYGFNFKSLEDFDGYEEVFDITVRDNSSYIIDGVYSHNSGGTYCWTAMEKAAYVIETEYPITDWNVYVIYIGDGEDFEPNKTVRYMETLVDMKINMFAYCEIDVENDIYGWRPGNTLIKDIEKKWKFSVKQEEGTNFYRNDEKHMLLSIIRSKEHIYPTLKHILFTPAKK